MIPDPIFCDDVSKDTLCFIGGISCLGNLSAHPSRWHVTRPGERGAFTLRLVGVIQNWLSFPSSLDSLDRFMEGVDDEGTEVEA